MRVIRRLAVALALSLTLVPLAGDAQRPSAVRRIGYLQADTGLSTPFYEVLRHGLRDFGYVEGQNFVIEFRWARGEYECLPDWPSSSFAA